MHLERFLLDLDRQWAPGLPPKLTLYIIGSSALFLQSDYRRGTKDSDVLKVDHAAFNDAVCAHLDRLAGLGSALHNKHRLYLDLVGLHLPFLPEDPVWHAHPIEAQHIALKVLDITDVCVSKLKRWVGSDRQDVSAMIARGHVQHATFIERVRSVLRERAFDARSEDLFPRIIAAAHEVERDLFALEQVSAFELPGWLRDD